MLELRAPVRACSSGKGCVCCSQDALIEMHLLLAPMCLQMLLLIIHFMVLVTISRQQISTLQQCNIAKSKIGGELVEEDVRRNMNMIDWTHNALLCKSAKGV